MTTATATERSLAWLARDAEGDVPSRERVKLIYREVADGANYKTAARRHGVSPTYVSLLMKTPRRGLEVECFAARIAIAERRGDALYTVLSDLTVLWRQIRAQHREMRDEIDSLLIDRWALA